MSQPKMTLEKLRALRPVWHKVEPIVVPVDIPEPTEAELLDTVEWSRSLKGRFESAPAALEWLQRNAHVARTYLVARLFCPKNKRLADLYCLPKDAAPVHDSGGYRLLIAPSARGRLAALGGMANNTREAGVAWWYVDDNDVWDLRCKCCPRPDGGVRAADFLGEDRSRGYNVVLL